MIRLLARIAMTLLANAVGLLGAAVILDDFSINGLSFTIAVAVFTVSTVVLGPLIMKIALSNANYLLGGIALITTLVGLIITNLTTSGIEIQGLSTWVIATLIIWVCSIIANIFLPLIIFKKVLANSKDNE